MSTSSRLHHSAVLTETYAPGARPWPMSQRDMVAASLLVRPERPAGAFSREMAWSRP